jgi:hypothetical protein
MAHKIEITTEMVQAGEMVLLDALESGAISVTECVIEIYRAMADRASLVCLVEDEEVEV